MKPQSVRSQRSFHEHMKTLYQTIDTLVYAGMIACAKECAANQWECKGYDCPFRKGNRDEPTPPDWCKLKSLRSILGEHFQQSDIKEVELTKE